MEKRKTLLMVMLCLVLAALICAVAVFGYALARSAFSDTDGMYAGEARWKISEITEETGSKELFVGTEKLKPDYQSYSSSTVHDSGTAPASSSAGPDSLSDDPGIRTYESFDTEWGDATGQRTKEWFGLLAVVENDSEVKADIYFTDTGVVVPVTDGCGSDDDGRYSDEEILMHFDATLYCCKDPDIGSAEAAESGEIPDGGYTVDGGGSGMVYIYADIFWITDLERDINDDVFVYDGSFGDEFDSWAGEHLAGLYFPVTIRAEQAE